ncbi:hypothetical protein [Flavobacterium sp. ACN6]|uniref:hypothetical protein n=1 Tax=Flavobacterium sp. ACN6 TaxID=1920426 RepID=UPI000BB2DC8D|nr:hypothetical protein [Flavobacterium sp. ACN6]PBJ06817.1 hypothetical protein BSF42_39920 [Flavobacterium sp. ACN6]
MKKKFTLEIANPCSENFDNMIPNSNGSFCDSCMKNVIDLSRKTNSEIAKFITESKDKNICARLKVSQLEEEFQHNETSRIANLKYAAVAASVLITSNIAAQQKEPIKTEIACAKPNTYKLGKVVQSHVVEKEVLITIKGKLLEAKTNKPFNKEEYPNLILFINSSEKAVKINPKTGEFSISTQILKDSKTLMVTVSGDDYYLSKEIPFNINRVKGNVLEQNIIIASDELTKIYIAGGLGINYTQ